MDGDLFDFIRALHETMQIQLFLLDEVHVYPRFEADLKKLYDVLDIKVIFTSSTALGMYESGYDLSRRVLLKTLYPFSLREYAQFKYGQTFDAVTLEDIVENRVSPDALRAGEHFSPYIQGGLMPFALREPQPLTLLENILKTVIRKDIPRIAKLLTDELDKIEQVVRFIGLSGVDGINYSSVAQNVHVTNYKAEQYITLLERAFVLHQVFPMGSNVLKEPKVVMALPYRLLYRSLSDAIGGLREDFVFEVGGKGKGRSQFKGVAVQRKIIFADGYDMTDVRKPLFLAGLCK